ncbi:hypothetical protein EN813_038405 [Mesorhizobium sp. M00.F.Ca.ET.170.01.1.1]|nr:hypothetical protein EN813_038405 [Mesorhizobium sp. M00.F.Ca.ET.170.01.1.1]
MPGRDDDDEFEKFKRIKEKTSEAARRFRDRRKEIKAAAVKTLTWLKGNKEFYKADGSLESGPWWDGLAHTDNAVLIDLRDFFFRCHLFDNGLRRMLSILIDNNSIILDGNIKKEIKFAVSYATMGLHHELMGYISAKKSNISIKLSDLAKRYDAKNTAYLRDRRIVPMSQLGMWTCQADESGYAISLGIPAEEFHNYAFQPVKAAFHASVGTFKAGDIRLPE